MFLTPFSDKAVVAREEDVGDFHAAEVGGFGVLRIFEVIAVGEGFDFGASFAAEDAGEKAYYYAVGYPYVTLYREKASEDAAAAETKKMVPEPGESAEAKEEEKGNAESADTAEGEKEDAQDVPAAPAEDPEMVYKDVLNAYINTVQSHSLDSRIEDAVKA